MTPTPPKGPTRFVPTLTEVVRDDTVPRSMPPSQMKAPAPGAKDLPSPSPVMALPPDLEETLVHRVMQRVDLVLERKLRDAIVRVVHEQTRSIVPRLREEVESVVRQAVYEALAEELSSR